MATSKKYFHDHFVMLLLSVNAFLVLAGSVFILLRLSTSQGNGYIVQYRPSLGINAYRTGSVVELVGLVAFLLLVLGIHSVLSYRAYRLHRQLAIMVLALGTLLAILTIIISNALLVLR
jgi:hypothetical protein